MNQSLLFMKGCVTMKSRMKATAAASKPKAKSGAKKTAAKKKTTTTKKKTGAKKATKGFRGRNGTVQAWLKSKGVMKAAKTEKGNPTYVLKEKYVVRQQGKKTTSSITHVRVHKRGEPRGTKPTFQKEFKKGGGDQVSKYNGGAKRKSSVRTSTSAQKGQKTKKRNDAKAGVKKTGAKKTGAKRRAKSQ